jgi:hypothetical protein
MKITHFAMVLAGIGLVAATAAEAQTRRTPQDGTYVRWQDENGRTHTRIIVQKRSYLDAGTNVQRGERKYTDYVMPPTYSATGIIDNTTMGRDKQTMPGPFDLPGKNNPRQW